MLIRLEAVHEGNTCHACRFSLLEGGGLPAISATPKLNSSVPFYKRFELLMEVVMPP
jgi:hypothetical protein